MTLIARPWYDLWLLRLLAVALLLLLPLAAISAPGCIPGLYGPQWPGAKLVPLVRGSHGWYGYGWCKGVDGAPAAAYRLCAHGECAANVGVQVGSIMGQLGLQLVGSTPQAVYGSWVDANPAGYRCDSAGPQVTAPGSPRGLACAELLALMAADAPAYAPPPSPTPVPTPPPELWRVKRNPQSTSVPTTRPVYPLVDGVLGTRALSKRATEGDACDTSKPTLASGADLWASYGASPVSGEVALCAKAAP